MPGFGLQSFNITDKEEDSLRLTRGLLKRSIGQMVKMSDCLSVRSGFDSRILRIKIWCVLSQLKRVLQALKLAIIHSGNAAAICQRRFCRPKDCEGVASIGFESLVPCRILCEVFL